MKRFLLFITSFFTFSVLFNFFISPALAEKSYYFPDVTIDMTINGDRSVDVVERRTFAFDGSFTRVFWDIPLNGNERITDIKLSDNISQLPYVQLDMIDATRPVGYFATRRQGVDYHIEAYHDSYNISKTFTLSYKLTGVIKKYQDVGELYWKAIGDRWDAKADRVKIVVHLPSFLSNSQFYIWGHGPLNGNARILDDSTAEFSVENLSQKQFVELRVLFPSNLLDGEPLAENALQRIQAEEKRFADRTKLIQQGRFITLILLSIVSIFWIIYWYRLFVKHGKEYKTHAVPKYLQLPPSKLHPALVEALVSQNMSVTPNSFSATILDLARKKKIEVQAIGKHSNGVLGIGSGTKYTYSLKLKDLNYESDNKLESFEKAVIRFVFQATDTIEITELKNRMKSEPVSTRTFFMSWTESIKKVAESKNFIEPESKKWITKFIISNILFWTGLFFGFAIVFGLLEIFLPAIVGVLAAVILPVYLIGMLFKRWTKDAGIQAEEWKAFKRYINNLSEIKNSLPQASVIWEEILVYGTALGVSKKIAEYLPLILSQKNATISPAWYHVYSASGGSMNASVTGIGTGIGTDFASSFSSMVSSFNTSFSSGSGGSFSGGGGGGGGGAD